MNDSRSSCCRTRWRYARGVAAAEGCRVLLLKLERTSRTAAARSAEGADRASASTTELDTGRKGIEGVAGCRRTCSQEGSLRGQGKRGAGRRGLERSQGSKEELAGLFFFLSLSTRELLVRSRGRRGEGGEEK